MLEAKNLENFKQSEQNKYKWVEIKSVCVCCNEKIIFWFASLLGPAFDKKKIANLLVLKNRP